MSIVENLGELIMADTDTGGGEPLVVKLPGTSTVKAGDPIALTADPARLHLFDAEGRAIRTWAASPRVGSPCHGGR